MSDCLLFAALFATYAVLRNSTFGGPTEQALFSLPFVLLETMVLLTSSFTSGLAMLAMHRKQKNATLAWLGVTFALGVTFLTLEFSEFSKFLAQGASWQTSGFLSAYFTLIGTHGLHILVGLLWMAVLGIQTWRSGITESQSRRLTLLSLFWHFLDIVWIFIFTIVYLMGKL